MKKYLVLLFAVSFIVISTGCVSTPVIPGDNSTSTFVTNAGDNSTSTFVTNAEYQLEKASWLKPIADGVMAVFCANKTIQACLYYEVISKGAGVAMETTKVAIAAYKKDPSALNLVNLKASVDQLNIAITGLDAGYKGNI